MNPDITETILNQSRVISVSNALVEEVSTQNERTGFIIISYSRSRPNQSTSTERVQLNVNRNTVILNSVGQNMCFCNIQRGMQVNAVFSSAMTRSIPPQSNAFLIIVQRGPRPSMRTTTGPIARVDVRNRFLYTGNPNNINSQTRFVITNQTTIRNRSGNPIGLRALRPGQMVRITHADFETAGIPPQTTAFHVQLL